MKSQKSKELTTIQEIHKGYDKKVISPTELIRTFLEASKKDRSGIYLTVCEEKAIEQAKAADRMLTAEGGVPREKSRSLESQSR